jgi:hypothetical protein
MTEKSMSRCVRIEEPSAVLPLPSASPITNSTDFNLFQPLSKDFKGFQRISNQKISPTSTKTTPLSAAPAPEPASPNLAREVFDKGEFTSQIGKIAWTSRHNALDCVIHEKEARRRSS